MRLLISRSGHERDSSHPNPCQARRIVPSTILPEILLQTETKTDLKSNSNFLLEFPTHTNSYVYSTGNQGKIGCPSKCSIHCVPSNVNLQFIQTYQTLLLLQGSLDWFRSSSIISGLTWAPFDAVSCSLQQCSPHQYTNINTHEVHGIDTHHITR